MGECEGGNGSGRWAWAGATAACSDIYINNNSQAVKFLMNQQQEGKENKAHRSTYKRNEGEKERVSE